MNLFLMDTDGEGMGLDLALRAQDVGHSVRYWLPTETSGMRPPYGEGLVERPVDWKPSMDWAEMIVLTGNSTYSAQLVEYFGKGYPIFGTNVKAAELEHDRGVGQEVLKKHGIKVPPYTVVTSAKDAINHVVKKNKPFAMKPWGGEADKAMTAIPRTVDEAVYTLMKWEKEGKFKGQLMLQEKCEGIEMGIAGWFGPGGWSSVIEESWEHKKFLTGDLGENTGEMGTVIRHVSKSKLFDDILEPLTDHLHKLKYVGDCSVNCIIDEEGIPQPLEFTMRLGWPDFCIRQEVFRGDPIVWMYDLLQGRDTLRSSTDIAVGVLLSHGDFPRMKDPPGLHSGAPIFGIDGSNYKHLHFQQMMRGKAPTVNKSIKMVDMELTAGQYVMVVSGAGKTVADAQAKTYATIDEIKWPGNMMYRVDIGDRLQKELPILQSFGYAKGMRYD